MFCMSIQCLHSALSWFWSSHTWVYVKAQTSMSQIHVPLIVIEERKDAVTLSEFGLHGLYRTGSWQTWPNLNIIKEPSEHQNIISQSCFHDVSVPGTNGGTNGGNKPDEEFQSEGVRAAAALLLFACCEPRKLLVDVTALQVHAAAVTSNHVSFLSEESCHPAEVAPLCSPHSPTALLSVTGDQRSNQTLQTPWKTPGFSL